MNRINKVFNKKKNLLSIYFTAGFPDINDTLKIIKELDKSQVDMIEIGLPFSDPLADGPTIQKSSEKALSNGMTTNLLFDQLKDLRKISEIPVVIMGYFNPILQYGIEKFCSNCKDVGIDGLIIPDLPADIFKKNYKNIFDKNIHQDLKSKCKVISSLTISEQTQIFGLPDVKFVEELCAWIILKPDTSCSEEEIREFCRGQIAHYKIPRYIRFVKEYPMTITGKVQKFAMRDKMIEELDLNQAKTA